MYWAERVMQELQEFCDDAQVAVGRGGDEDQLPGTRALMAEFESIKLCAGEIDRDAARYRFLRNQDINVICEGGVFAGMTPENVALTGAALDAAIDVRL